MLLQGFNGVLGAGRLKTTTASRSAHKMEERPECPAVAMNEKNKDRFHSKTAPHPSPIAPYERLVIIKSGAR
jgi:hypothetical protein